MTAYSRISSLKFDEASVALGDEMRAARAHLGRSIDDVEAALKIKAKYIDAIENCDRSLLPERAYADGFIKTYARYLGLDPDETLARFERDSAAISAAREEPKRGRKAVAAANVGTYTPTHDPLAAYDRRVGVGSAIGRGFRLILSLWPLALLAAIIFGVWYGVRAARDAGMIPENISIIGEAEEVRPIFEANIADGNLGGTEPATLVERPSELSYANLGVVPYWHTPSFDVPSQDGPIEEINAETAGVFSPRIVPEINTDLRHTSARNGPFPFDAREIAAEARAALTAEMLRGAHHQAGRDAQREVEVAALDGAQVIDTTTTQAATPGAIIPADPSTVALVARADTWIEIRDPLGAVTYTGVLSSGETVPIDSSAGLKVKIGNAGGLYVRMGALEYGPFGGSGVVMRNVQLDRPSILSRFGATVTQ